MPINKFTTLLDLSRQAKILTGETATFDGKISLGIPFSGYPTGVDTATTVSLGVISTQTAVFSGGTGTTVFDVSNIYSPNYNPSFDAYSASTWSNPVFSANTSGLTLPITILSADTQVIGPFWTLTQTGYTGEYIIGTQYTGYSVTYSFGAVTTISSPNTFSGLTTATQEIFSAGTLDYKGPLDYLYTSEDATIKGRLTTNKLTIQNGASSATTNYLLTQVDDTGKAEWTSPLVALSAFTIWTAGTGTNSAVLGGSNGIASGSTSVSEGSNTIAGGLASHAEGSNTIAIGVSSHAEGDSTSAIGVSSHAEGDSSMASGNVSHAEGFNTIASNFGSHAEGSNTTASGLYSHAEGELTIASNRGSHAEGYKSLASGYGSHAEGGIGISGISGGTASGPSSHAEGIHTLASDTASHAEGSGTTASGLYSHAEGELTIASNRGSHAEGILTVSSNSGSHAEGDQTTASGYASHAEGMNTIASGDYSHSEGFGDSNGYPTASGLASHAEGYATTASGDYSHAQGTLTVASGTSSHAGGHYSEVHSNYGFIHSYFSNIFLNSDSSSILGGSLNTIDKSEKSGIFVGSNNTISGDTISTTESSIILGGNLNSLNTAYYSVIAGGSGNTITKNTDNLTQPKHSGIFVGINNKIIPRYGSVGLSASYCAIVGGESNTISGHSHSFIGGGFNNLIACSGDYNAIVGGQNNINHAANGVIIGGQSNTLGNDPSCPSKANNSVIIGGNFNFIDTTSGDVENSVILGGNNITASNSDTVYVPNMIINTGGTDSKLGINTSTPEYVIDANGNSAKLVLIDTYTGADAPFKSLVFSGDSTNVSQIVASTKNYTGGLGYGLAMGSVGNNSISTASSALVGTSGDTYINSTSQTNNLNIINRSGGSGTNNIRMYAGVNSVTAAPQPDFHIQGDGGTRGYIGIYTGNPTEILHIVSTSSSKIRLDADINNTDETATAAILLTQDGYGSTANIGITPDVNNDLMIGVNSGGGTTPDIRFNTRSDGTVFTTTADTKMILKNDGKLGINIDSPDYLIDAMGTGNRLYYSSAGVGSLNISATTGLPSLGVVAGTSNSANQLTAVSMGVRAWNDSTYTVYGYPGDAFIYAGIYTNGLNIISNDGSTAGTGADYIRFYAGQASGAGASNNPDLHIQGSGSSRGFVAINVPYNQTPTERLDVNGNARFRSIGSSASAGALHYTSDGTLTTNTSDERLKTNIVTLTNALEQVKQLRGVKYNWTEEPNGDVRIGLIAQEVNNVVPELTFVNKNTEELYMGVYYDNVVALLIEAVKELSSGVTTSNNSHLETQTIPFYTPTSSSDEYGSEGNITIDDNYMYVKTITGWKRTNLESF